MRLLFAITICCFCTVLWVALALARRIRLGQVLTAKPNAKPVRIPPAREFFEAGEFRTPRPLHLDQEIFKQKPRRPLADINLSFEDQTPSVAASVADLRRHNSPEIVPIRPRSTAYATLFGQNVSITQIETRNEGGNGARRPATDGSLTSLPVDVTRRIPPKPDRASGLRRRVDLSQFNNDLGDLTDPYTNLLRGTGTQGPAATDKRIRLEH